MTYFVLAVRLPGEPLWGVEFGDYDLETVEFERDDMRDHDIPAKSLKILRIEPLGRQTEQDAINRAIAVLNCQA